jgi:PAS domain S-box-containing protein
MSGDKDTKGMSWTALPTELSLKTYSDKKCIFGRQDSILHNLQGFEYYAGGIFGMKSGASGSALPARTTTSIDLIDAFDWRTKHGAQNPNSPYYDKDSLGGGWATPIRSQAIPQYCGSCWSHFTVATAEIMTNLYYNRHYDLNLSEHYLMTCSCIEACFNEGRPCSGGRSTKAAEWIVNYGVTNEENFPYQAVDSLTCSDSGANPTEHLRFAKGIFSYSIPSEDSLKQFLVHYGPLNLFIESLWHCLCCVGYFSDSLTGETIWILKNSFGVSSGNNGYLYTKLSMSDVRTADAFIPPVISKVYTDNNIRCVDLDKDGYYNWGIGPKPATCPDGCSSEEDCDDSRNDLGPQLPDGSCKRINSGINQLPKSKSEILYFYGGNPFKSTVIINFQTSLYASVLIHIYDITDRKQMEAALRESENRYRQLTEMMPDAVVVGQDGKNVYANSAAARLLRASSPEELVGLNVLSTIDPAQHEFARQQMQRVLAGEKLPPFEDRFVRLDGSLVPVEISTPLSVRTDD